MDLQYAKQQFERYLDNYDRADDKVRLKIAHTYGVTECSRQIAERMGLSEEDCSSSAFCTISGGLSRSSGLTALSRM